MNILSAIGGLLLAAMEITVSPDQPLPYSYVDDPLIVEVRSDTPAKADITITLSTADGDTVSQAFPATLLGPEINRWCALKNIPALRGPWNVKVEVRADAGSSVHEAGVYRIDRPASAYTHPLYASGDTIDRDTLLALRAVAINTVRIPVGHADIALLLEEIARLGMKAIIVLGSETDSDVAAPALAESHCATIERWELSATKENGAQVREVAERLQALPCGVPVTISVSDSRAVPEILAAIALPNLQHLIIAESPEGPELLDTIRDDLAATGVESPVLEYRVESGDADAFSLAYFDAIAHRAQRVGFPVRMVLEAGGLQRGLAYLNGLTHGVSPAPYAGRLPQPGKTRALLFATGNYWTLAYWGGVEGDKVTVPWNTDFPYAFIDSWNNATQAEFPEGDTWTASAPQEVCFIKGMGGPLLKATLLSETKSSIAHVLAQKSLEPAWSADARSAMLGIQEAPDSEQTRVHFFTLLRAFPEIEDRWHTGQLPRPVAVAALAHLADLARTLCRLEAAREVSFLEPLADTLARCEEYQSLYLTGVTTTPQARVRGDWLVQEVRRLMDEAESLAAADAKIEADAVAALAEWRARGLEFAVKAGPLSDQMELPKVEEPKAEVKEPETPAKKAPAKKAPAKKSSTRKKK